MRLKSILTMSVALSAIIANKSAEADQYYVSLFGGASSTDSTFDVGPFYYSKTATRTDYGGRLYTYSEVTDRTLLFTHPSFTVRVRQGGPLSHSFFNYSRQTFTNLNAAEGFQVESDLGFVVGAAIGLDLENGWRTELEAAFRSYKLDGPPAFPAYQSYQLQTFVSYSLRGFVSITTLISGITQYNRFNLYTSAFPFTISHTRYASPVQSTVAAAAQSDGELTSFSLMANVWYDYQLGDDSPYALILGGGIGMAKLDVDYRARVTFPANALGVYTFPPATDTARTSAEDWVFAWQAGAGLGYEFNNGMMLSAQYRYFATGDVDVGGQDVNVQSHEGIVALRFPLGN